MPLPRRGKGKVVVEAPPVKHFADKSVNLPEVGKAFESFPKQNGHILSYARVKPGPDFNDNFTLDDVDLRIRDPLSVF